VGYLPCPGDDWITLRRQFIFEPVMRANVAPVADGMAMQRIENVIRRSLLQRIRRDDDFAGRKFHL
jgi:hypothetical protein